MPFSVRLDNYQERLEDAFETANESLEVLYMGDEKGDYTDTLEEILEDRYRGEVELHYTDIDQEALERSENTEQIQADAAALPYREGSFDLVVTNHLLCNPSGERTESETVGAILEESKRVSRGTEPIHEAC